MKPIVKYQGGKSRELPIIKQLLPTSFSRIVEPFCGGAAVSFGLETPALLSDINDEIINLYKVIAGGRYNLLQSQVDTFKTYNHDKLEQLYYESRDIINSKKGSSYDRALAYIVMRQLCFSGMERYNSNGEFNVPFGHYPQFTCNLSKEHNLYLKQCIIRNEGFDMVFGSVDEDDFVFIDPPYLDRLGYTDGDGGMDLHLALYSELKETSAKWMIVHSEHEFYLDMYADYHIVRNDFSYAQRFGKDKDHSGAKVTHLYITNYEIHKFW